MRTNIIYRFKFFRILFYFLSFLILFEIILRVISPNILREEKFPLIFKPDSIYGYSLIPNSCSELVGMEHRKTVTVNQKGYLGKDFKLVKDTNFYRIIIIGECQLSGMYLNDREKDVVQMLEEKFHTNNYNVEVINCSIDGAYREACLTKFIKNEIVKLDPDMIITEYWSELHKVLASREVYKDFVITYPANNDSLRNKAIKLIDNIYDHKVLRVLFDFSYVFKGFMYSWRHCLDRTKLQMNFEIWQTYETYRRKKMKDADAIIGYNDKFTFGETNAMYMDLKENLEKHAIKLVLFSNMNLLEVKNNEAFKDIDLSKYSFISPKIPMVVPNSYAHDKHYSAIGLKQVADSIFKDLIEKKTIPLKYKMSKIKN